MSLHREDYLALLTRARDFCEAHPYASVLVLATIGAFIAGYALG